MLVYQRVCLKMSCLSTSNGVFWWGKNGSKNHHILLFSVDVSRTKTNAFTVAPVVSTFFFTDHVKRIASRGLLSWIPRHLSSPRISKPFNLQIADVQPVSRAQPPCNLTSNHIQSPNINKAVQVASPKRNLQGCWQFFSASGGAESALEFEVKVGISKVGWFQSGTHWPIGQVFEGLVHHVFRFQFLF